MRFCCFSHHLILSSRISEWNCLILSLKILGYCCGAQRMSCSSIAHWRLTMWGKKSEFWSFFWNFMGKLYLQSIIWTQFWIKLSNSFTKNNSLQLQCSEHILLIDFALNLNDMERKGAIFELFLEYHGRIESAEYRLNAIEHEIV